MAGGPTTIGRGHPCPWPRKGPTVLSGLHSLGRGSAPLTLSLKQAGVGGAGESVGRAHWPLAGLVPSHYPGRGARSPSPSGGSTPGCSGGPLSWEVGLRLGSGLGLHQAEEVAAWLFSFSFYFEVIIESRAGVRDETEREVHVSFTPTPYASAFHSRGPTKKLTLMSVRVCKCKYSCVCAKCARFGFLCLRTCMNMSVCIHVCAHMCVCACVSP